MTWTAPTQRADGTLVADHKPSKGAVDHVRVFYDKDSADKSARFQRKGRGGRRSRVFSRTVKADGAELVLYVVVTRHAPVTQEA